MNGADHDYNRAFLDPDAREAIPTLGIAAANALGSISVGGTSFRCERHPITRLSPAVLGGRGPIPVNPAVASTTGPQSAPSA
ncbi:MAG TPA: hypothetical protein VHE78_03115 [Gemmatimonadaceae bacterium]|nr:hypothetical protein [Gemmatimonadaceae bacterium]